MGTSIEYVVETVPSLLLLQRYEVKFCSRLYIRKKFLSLSDSQVQVVSMLHRLNKDFSVGGGQVENLKILK